MVWDRVPHRWEVAPYTGNGNVGFLFYQAKGEAKNVTSIYVGRHDYYDHRLPQEGKEMLWNFGHDLSSGPRAAPRYLRPCVLARNGWP